MTKTYGYTGSVSVIASGEENIWCNITIKDRMNRDLEFFFLDGVETQSVDISQALANKGIDPEVEPYYMDVFVRAEATGMMGTGNATL